MIANLTIMCETPNRAKIHIAYGKLPERSLEAVEGSIDIDIPNLLGQKELTEPASIRVDSQQAWCILAKKG